MTTDVKIRDEKIQCNINREAAKNNFIIINKIDKYEYLTGEGALLSDESRMIEQGKLTYSSLGSF